MSSPKAFDPSLLSGTAILPLPRIRDTRDAFLSVETLLETARKRLAGLGCARIGAEDLEEATRGLYRMMLDDPALETAVSELAAREGLGAEEAFRRHLDDLAEEWRRNGGYFAQRAFDLEDLRSLVMGQSVPGIPRPFPEDAILILPTLLATELMGMKWSSLKAVIAGRGGRNSHPAILLQSQSIPLFLLGEDLPEIKNGDRLEIDIKNGTVTRNGMFWKHLPDVSPSTNARKETNDIPSDLRIMPCISSLAEIVRLPMERLEGIGLVRTEIQPILEGRMPTENHMAAEYGEMVTRAQGKPVRFRLWDFEPDKPAPGLRTTDTGMDFLLNHPEWTLRQIRALLRTAARGLIAMILPMVRSQSQVDRLIELRERASSDMFGSRLEKRPVVPMGAMVETPEMVRLISDVRGLDFLVIGTNDLACSFQCRCREDGGFDPECFADPEFVRYVEGISLRVAETGMSLSLCGEGAGFPPAISEYAKAGIREFCPSPEGLSSYPRFSNNK